MKLLRGITLIELLVSVSILLILAAVTIPLLQHTLQQQQIRVTQERLVNVLNFARTYAINQNTMVTVCPSVNHQDCLTDWQQPLMVFIQKTTTAKHLLQVIPATTRGQLTAKIFPTTQYFRFNSQGFPDNQNGTFSYCYAQHGWNIVINRFGRIRVVVEACS